MRGAMVVSWGNNVRGREKLALDVFGKALAFTDAKAKDGTIESHEEYFAVDGNFGELAGFMVVKGEIEKLRQMQQEEEWRKLTFAGGAICENFRVQVFAGGNEQTIQEMVGLGLTVEQELGLI